MDHSESIAVFKKNCGTLGISLSQTQIDQFMAYYDMLVEKNKVMNLTGITDLDEVLCKHYLDSLSIYYNKQFNKKINSNKSETGSQGVCLLDVGTGAGFPGIPLKIVFPNLKITLLDSLNKRILFLQDVIRQLQLKEIEAIHGRAEDFARNQKEEREQYDFVVSRAVANLSSLCEYCIPFVKIGGSFISYKSSDNSEERKNAERAVHILGGQMENVDEFVLPGSEISRTLIEIRKVKPTSPLYPRKAGMPVKKPL